MANPFNHPRFQFLCSPNKRPVAVPKRPHERALRKSQLGLIASQVAQVVKNHQPARAGGSGSIPSEMWVRSLGWEDALEKEMAARSSILAWRIPWTEEPGGLQFMGSQESNMTEQLTFSLHFLTIPLTTVS